MRRAAYRGFPALSRIRRNHTRLLRLLLNLSGTAWIPMCFRGILPPRGDQTPLREHGDRLAAAQRSEDRPRSPIPYSRTLAPQHPAQRPFLDTGLANTVRPGRSLWPLHRLRSELRVVHLDCRLLPPGRRKPSRTLRLSCEQSRADVGPAGRRQSDSRAQGMANEHVPNEGLARHEASRRTSSRFRIPTQTILTRLNPPLAGSSHAARIGDTSQQAGAQVSPLRAWPDAF